MPSTRTRTLVLTFDGATGHRFGNNHSNVVRFFRALKKDEPAKQMAYYQPGGVGAYNGWGLCLTAIDQVIALHLNDNVKDGYRYLMQNYHKGDAICLFGFSQGAYTARALSGMLYKVGLLPPYSGDEQLDCAFKIYQSTDQISSELSKEFKDTFAIPVAVDFVGVWDTVSSVGIIPRTLPYSSVNSAVKTFRHALALDERRARFRPNIWNEPSFGCEELNDIPDLKPRGDTPRDNWTYQPPNRDFADVEEVWFAGCHADVGGGSHDNLQKNSLSNIPLRWMVEECVCKTNILFDRDYLRAELGLDLDSLNLLNVSVNGSAIGVNHSASLPSPLLDIPSPRTPSSTIFSPIVDNESIRTAGTFSTALTGMLAHSIPGAASGLRHLKDQVDIIAPIFDQLIRTPSWWILEFIPTLSTYQNEDGTWIHQRVQNLGRGRYVPHHDNEIKVHVSVKEKMEKDKKYRPAASNWDMAMASNMIKWVS